MEKGQRLGTWAWGSVYQNQVCPGRAVPGSGWVTLDVPTPGLGSEHRTLPQTPNPIARAGLCCGKPPGCRRLPFHF